MVLSTFWFHSADLSMHDAQEAKELQVTDLTLSNGEGRTLGLKNSHRSKGQRYDPKEKPRFLRGSRDFSWWALLDSDQ